MINKLFSLFLALCIFQINCAPRHKSSGSSTTFDQKQTGEYNIQLHLKDFQIIAVVGDDSFGSLGDYDYDYDYSDFTIKPNPSLTSSTTKKPTDDSKPSTTSPTTLNGSISDELSQKTTTKKPLITATHPYPIISPLTTPVPILVPTTNKQGDTVNEVVALSTTTQTSEKPESFENVQKGTSTAPSAATVNPIKIITITALPPNISTVEKSSTRPPATNRPVVTTQIPGQIPVIVQDFSIVRNETPIVKDKHSEDKNSDRPELNKDKRAEGVTSITIVPMDSDSDGNLGDVLTLNEQPALGEILHYRRCAQGYQRDKRGRCRKVRRPQIPLGLTRFASNFAARFRQPGLAESNGSLGEPDSDDISNTHL